MYLKILEQNKIIPNFWCSEEYWEMAGWKEEEADDGCSTYIQDETGCNMLPPTGIFCQPCWASFPEGKTNKKFLDYNFIYDPKNFLDLSGGQWAVFRKNIRKFPQTCSNLKYERPENSELAMDAFMYWLEKKLPDEEIYDDEVILKYLEKGKNKKILMEGNNICGINIWDENYMFVNFRYCFCKNLPFLSEYMRYLFYTDPEILQKNKLVNDGGSLDSPSLYNFKKKLNPVEIYSIYTTL